MNVIDFEYDLENGFAWIVLEDQQDPQVNIVQCCLEQDYDNQYLTVIDRENCGHNEGICGDANAPAFEKWGEGRCMKTLFEHAKKHDFKLF